MPTAFVPALPLARSPAVHAPRTTAPRPPRRHAVAAAHGHAVPPPVPKPQPDPSIPHPGPTISAPTDIVLTHATADFDSLAAAVGLAKLRGPHCRVVLPAGAHPSVRRYLSLHKSFFPIVDAKVVDPTRLRWIAIVDTASPARLGPAASWLPLADTVVVVDHHDPSANSAVSSANGSTSTTATTTTTTQAASTALIPGLDGKHAPGSQTAPARQDLSALVTGDLEMIVEPVGAATTLVVERLQARPDLSLTRAEATLLALAIHTDTGSLTFENTTPRDAHALAWLLSAGACQRSVAQFARHFLDAGQQRLLTGVLDGLSPRRVNGHVIAAPVVQVDSFVPGMAVVAQTALDLAGLDALVLAVVSPAGRRKNASKDGVQVSLIGRARARAEGVHFGRLFAPLGGGGHAKAGSASVRVAAGEADDVVEAVVAMLEQQLPAPMLARDFMSTDVVCIGMDETMGHARDALFQSGHTGLAVVHGGADGKQVAGVVSRQDVALAERRGLLHTPVKGWVARKVITVAPDTPLHVVEAKLVDHEIGRVPVVEEGGRVVGIVTRSDVLLQRRLCSPDT